MKALLEDDYPKEEAEMCLSDVLYDTDVQKEFLQSVFAFVDAHPVSLSA